MSAEAVSRQKWMIGGVIIAILLVGVAFCGRLLSKKGEVFEKREGFYAVFLTNNQVYFGNISQESSKTVYLKNIYYIQSKNGADKDQDISLLKLGNELHGPEDMMEINREHVLFIEKLKEDGKVSKAIQSFQQK